MSYEEDNKRFQEELNRITETVGSDRWLLENGLISESVQQHLVAFGWLSSDFVSDVEVILDTKNKQVTYKVVLNKQGYKKYLQFKKWLPKKPKTIFGMYLKLRAVRDAIKINVEANLQRFVSDYLPGFGIAVEVTGS